MSPAVSASECQVEVTANRAIAASYFSMRLAGPARLARFRPGQFLMLGWTDGRDPLLPRAMSIRRARLGVRGAGCEVEILYKVCGRGTALLAAMRPGRSLRVLGPLGNGFDIPRKVTGVVLIAGGVGVPPITALVETLANRKAARRIAVTVLLGGRSKADLLCVSDLRRAGATVHMATEDGSIGHKGLVTELLEQHLNSMNLAPSPKSPRFKSPRTPLYKEGTGGISVGVGGIYACGPHPMLAALAPIAEKYNLPYQASLEANMACGFGACMGCVVPVKGDERERSYRLVCKDGPVFDGREILWDQHATKCEAQGAGCVKAEGQGV